MKLHCETVRPVHATIRSLECWSNYGCAGDRTSDAYAARAALARGCRYGLASAMGRLLYVFLPNVDVRAEREIQTWATKERYPTPRMNELQLGRLLKASGS